MDAKREPLIEFKGVRKTFGTRNILNQIDFSIYEGEVTTLIGLSGTGKSVTLKHIIGMLKPDEGQIFFRSKPIDQMIAQKLALERRKKHKVVPPAAGDHPNRVPIASVVVSGADLKSYLLKDGKIVIQETISIANPDQPLGTHVLVLKSLEGKHPTWSAVPIRHADSTTAVRPTDKATLDRINFDPDFVEQGLRSMHPGMSMMITNLTADPETRSDRDFVIVTSEFVQR